jgi:hypothetical protein
VIGAATITVDGACSSIDGKASGECAVQPRAAPTSIRECKYEQR